MRDKKLQRELERFGDDLKKVKKPRFNDAKKQFLKMSIMSKIDQPVAEYVRETSKKVHLSSAKKARVKERVFDLIKERYKPGFNWRTFWSFQKRFVSALLIVVFVFGFFSFWDTDTGVVRADTFTLVDEVKGEVYVERAGGMIEAYVGMELIERDKVLTGEDGFVEIRYFEDSISRLASDSVIVINKLFRPVDSSVTSYVEVELFDGVMWSKVVSLIEKHSSFVVEAVDLQITSKKAAFNLEVDDEAVEMDVYNHVVDVENVDGEIERVKSGEKAYLNDYNEIVVLEIEEDEKKLAWVEQNLNSDVAYLSEVEQRLLIAKAESIGVDLDEDFSLEASLKDKTLLFLTFDDVEKQKKELEIAEKNFIAAQIKLNEEQLSEGDKDDINKALITFSDEVSDFYSLVDEVENTDIKYADELEKFVEDKIYSQKKDLTFAKTDTPLSDAKDVIDDLEVLTADDDVEVAELKHSQALDNLSEAADAVEVGDVDWANEALLDYQEHLSDVVEIIESFDEDDDENDEAKEHIVDSVVEDIYYLDDLDFDVAKDVQEQLKDDLDSFDYSYLDYEYDDDVQYVEEVFEEDDDLGSEHDEVPETDEYSWDFSDPVLDSDPTPDLTGIDFDAIEAEKVLPPMFDF